MLEKKVVKTEPVYEDWLEGYNMSVTGQEKQRYLQIGLTEDPSPENKLREKIFVRRYTKNGKITGADYFLAQWKELEFQQQQLGTVFGKKKALKCVDKVRENLMIPEGTTESLQEVLYLEYVNMVSILIMLCQTDRNYKSLIFGFGTINDEKLTYKIAADLYGVGCGVPLLAGRAEAFALLSRAAEKAFFTVYPRAKNVWEAVAEEFRKNHALPD